MTCAVSTWCTADHVADAVTTRRTADHVADAVPTQRTADHVADAVSTWRTADHVADTVATRRTADRSSPEQTAGDVGEALMMLLSAKSFPCLSFSCGAILASEHPKMM